jgi:hypothetical protein
MVASCRQYRSVADFFHVIIVGNEILIAEIGGKQASALPSRTKMAHKMLQSSQIRRVVGQSEPACMRAKRRKLALASGVSVCWLLRHDPARQLQPEAGAAGAGLQGQFAARHLGHATGNCQAKPGAVGTGGEKRIKNPGRHLCAHAGAVILHGQF